MERVDDSKAAIPKVIVYVPLELTIDIGEGANAAERVSEYLKKQYPRLHRAVETGTLSVKPVSYTNANKPEEG